MPTALALALSLALAAAMPAPPPAATAARPPAGAAAPRDWDKPPPGTKDDQALWQSAHDVNTKLVVEQHVAAKLTQGAKASEERLPELAASGAVPKARADELAARLLKAWTANLELVQSQWPVSKVRVCGYPLLNFEPVMSAQPRNEAQLADMRKDLVQCVDRANSVLRPLERSNEELRAALAEIERELAAMPRKPAPGPAGKSAPGPAASAAGGASAKPD